MYSLHRTRDKAGDSGPMSQLIHPVTFERKMGKPEIGYCVSVGSFYARTYSAQDYWTTTPVIEILEDTGDLVRFKTRNSEYIWKEF